MDNRKWEADAIGSAPTAPAAPSAGYPTNGDPGAGQNATEPGAWWFHSIGEEIRQVIEASGLTPDHADLTQLKVSIQALITAALAPDASTTVKGLLEIATNAETISGASGVLAVVPSSLLAFLGAGEAATGGYIAIAYRDASDGTRKNIIVQWGASVAVPADSNSIATFPITFPTAAFIAQVSFRSGNITGAEGTESYNNLTTNQITLQNGTNAARDMTYFVIGH